MPRIANKTVTVEGRTIELLADADLSKATEVQAELYRYLVNLPSPTCTIQQLMQQFGLSIPQPVWSRLEHLAQKGLVKLA